VQDVKHDPHCRPSEFQLGFTPTCRGCGNLMYAKLWELLNARER
jgi:hypothetical protein